MFATDAEGRFVILGVGSGRWRMQATHTDHLPATEREIELNDGFEADLDEFRLAPAAAISGQVRDGQGLPVAGAWLSLEASAPGQSDDESLAGSAEDLLSTTSDAEGRFHFSGLRPGTYTLECEGEAGSARLEALPLAEGKNDSLAIRLER